MIEEHVGDDIVVRGVKVDTFAVLKTHQLIRSNFNRRCFAYLSDTIVTNRKAVVEDVIGR